MSDIFFSWIALENGLRSADMFSIYNQLPMDVLGKGRAQQETNSIYFNIENVCLTYFLIEGRAERGIFSIS